VADEIKQEPKWVCVLRWAARAGSIASVCLVLAFIVGERSLPATRNEWVGFLFFPGAVCAGMILAWFEERLGGAVSCGGLLVFYIFNFVVAGRFPKGWAWFAFAAPGFLFLMSGYLSPRSRRVAN
jgi:hypothetical protein